MCFYYEIEMYIYIILITYLLFSVIFVNRYPHRDKYVFRFNLVILFLLSAFRGIDVGTDTINYYYLFQHLDVDEIRGLEYGWYIINYLAKFIFGDYRAFLIIVSFLIHFFLSKAIPLYTPKRNTALFFYVTLYFYFMSFNITRQILSLVIVLYSLQFLQQEETKLVNILRYILWILIATSIHTSSIIALFLPFIEKIQINKIAGILLLTGSILFYSYASMYLMDIVTNIEHYSMHLANETMERDSLSLNMVALSLIISSLLLFANINNLHLKCAFLGIFIANMLVNTTVIARIGLVLRFPIIIFLSNISWNTTSKILQHGITYVTIIYAYVACVLMLIANSEGVCPYSFL